MVLEYVAAALPRRYRVKASAQGVVYVEDAQATRQFVVRRGQLSTEARAEWSAIEIVRAIKAEGRP